MPEAVESIIPLVCGAQSYDWGKIGQDSTVARFVHNVDPSFAISNDKPYAELWMGTHPSLPSKCDGHSSETKGKTLAQVVKQEPDKYLLHQVTTKFDSKSIPYLFKVLSIRKALSIQAHPDKQLARELHKRDPKNYPDDNHKPEMAIAITDFEGLCGFRPLAEIAHFLNAVPSFASLVGDSVKTEFLRVVSNKDASESQNKDALKQLFAAIMTSDPASIEANAKDLISQAQNNSFDSTLCPVLLRVNEQFPLDIGLFCCLVLNYVTLSPGEAMYLQAKDPHAYISGDIVECMAASDNVVRAGFTPKFKDVDTLVNMLTYSYAPVAEQKMKPLAFPRGQSSNPNTKFILYDPPIDEFSVVETRVPANATASHKGVAGPSIVIVTEGEAEVTSKTGDKIKAIPGTVFFVIPNQEMEVAASKDFVCYRAFVEV